MSVNEHQPPDGPDEISHHAVQEPLGDHAVILVEEPTGSLFNTKDIRSAFISKVYTILLLQLSLASVLVGWISLDKTTNEYMRHSGEPWLFVAFGLFFIAYLLFVCVESIRRIFPVNLLIMTLITLLAGLLAAIISANYQSWTVLCAFGAIDLATLVVLLVAKCSPLDITGAHDYWTLGILGLVHLMASLAQMLALVPMGYGSATSYLLAGFCAFLVSVYILVHLKLMMDGHRAKQSPDAHILAAGELYFEALHLFHYLLVLFSGRNKRPG